MHYLIQGKLIAPDLLRLSHADFVELIQSKLVPTLKLLEEANAIGRLLAGGLPAGSRDWILFVDLPLQNTHRVVRQFLQSLPIFELYEWQTTPLETIAETLKQFENR